MLWMNKIRKKREHLEEKIGSKMEIIIYTSWIYSMFFVELILDRRYLKHIHQRAEKGGQILDYYTKFGKKSE